MKNSFVAILMGSKSDADVMSNTVDVLKKFGVPYEARVLSAHRTPKDTDEYIKSAEQNGCRVFIAAAGMAAHLAGAVAARTVAPVIGVPMDQTLSGLDSLLATAQMPGGIPVATVAIGKAGARNAAYLAIQILAVNNDDLYKKLCADREERATEILNTNLDL